MSTITRISLLNKNTFNLFINSCYYGNLGDDTWCLYKQHTVTYCMLCWRFKQREVVKGALETVLCFRTMLPGLQWLTHWFYLQSEADFRLQLPGAPRCPIHFYHVHRICWKEEWDNALSETFTQFPANFHKRRTQVTRFDSYRTVERVIVSIYTACFSSIKIKSHTFLSSLILISYLIL